MHLIAPMLDHSLLRCRHRLCFFFCVNGCTAVSSFSMRYTIMFCTVNVITRSNVLLMCTVTTITRSNTLLICAVSLIFFYPCLDCI